MIFTWADLKDFSREAKGKIKYYLYDDRWVEHKYPLTYLYPHPSVSLIEVINKKSFTKHLYSDDCSLLRFLSREIVNGDRKLSDVLAKISASIYIGDFTYFIKEKSLGKVIDSLMVDHKKGSANPVLNRKIFDRHFDGRVLRPMLMRPQRCIHSSVLYSMLKSGNFKSDIAFLKKNYQKHLSIDPKNIPIGMIDTDRSAYVYYANGKLFSTVDGCFDGWSRESWGKFVERIQMGGDDGIV